MANMPVVNVKVTVDDEAEKRIKQEVLDVVAESIKNALANVRGGPFTSDAITYTLTEMRAHLLGDRDPKKLEISCSACGDEWTEGHQCKRVICPECDNRFWLTGE